MKLAIPDLLHPPTPQELHKRGVMPDRRAMERVHARVERFLQDCPVQDLDAANEIINREFVGKAPDQMPGKGRTPLEKAQDLCYDAFDALGRRQLQLARQSLALSPDCADAYVILAECAGDAGEARHFYEQAVAAGERALGKEIFEREVGNFWGLIHTRPYMRALCGLAQLLVGEDELDAAIDHYQELLRLNPNDNQGVRHLLLPLLLELDEVDAAQKLLETYEGDPMSIWRYGGALLAFRKQGDSPDARAHLARAVKANPYVPAFLIGDEEISADTADTYALGSREEAAFCAEELEAAWDAIDGAVEWLADQMEKR